MMILRRNSMFLVMGQFHSNAKIFPPTIHFQLGAQSLIAKHQSPQMTVSDKEPGKVYQICNLFKKLHCNCQVSYLTVLLHGSSKQIRMLFSIKYFDCIQRHDL